MDFKVIPTVNSSPLSIMGASASFSSLYVTGSQIVSGRLFPSGGFSSPYTRILYVDKGGRGDYTTIQSAINAASSSGASSTTPWEVKVSVGTFSENINLPIGIHLKGAGQYASIINGTVDFHSGTTISGFRISPTTANANTYALKFILSTTGQFGVMEDINASVFGANTGSVSVVKCTGTGTGGLLYVRNCLLYSANRFTGVSSTSETVIFHLESDYKMYVECFASHLKTSSGGNTSPQSIMTKVDCVTPVWGYVHLAASDWEDVYGGRESPHPIMLKSVNTVHSGLLVAADMLWAGPTDRQPSVVSVIPMDVYYYSKLYRSLEVINGTRLTGSLAVSGTINLARGDLTITQGNVAITGSLYADQIQTGYMQIDSVTIDSELDLRGPIAWNGGVTSFVSLPSGSDKVPYLHADLLDGYEATALLNRSNHIGSQSWSTINKSGSLPSDIGASPVSHSHSAADITTGTFNDSRLSTNVPLKSVANTYTESQTVQAGAASTAIYIGRVSSDVIARFAILADGKHEWGTGSLARDTNLYRSAADTLRTDDAFSVGGTLSWGGGASLASSNTVARLDINNTFTNTQRVSTTSGNAAWITLVTGESLARWFMEGTGKHWWSSGTGSYDTNLYRFSSASLKTDSSLTIGGILDHDGSSVGFYGATPVSRSAAIPTVSGTSTTAELAASINAISLVLKNLGLTL